MIGVALATVGASGVQPPRPPVGDRPMVTQAEVERWKQELTNWGRWGQDDEIGTLNLITPDKRKQAAALVRAGISVSLARDAETEEAIDNPRPHQVTPLGITADEIRVSYHGFMHTHLDFLNHNFIGDGVTYNGYQPDPAVVAAQGGHSRNTVHNAKAGIVTRGILIDMARFKNVPYLEPGTPIYIEDLEAWERAAGVRVGSGDVVLVRSGRWARRAELGPWRTGREAAGLHASVVPWLRERGVAMLGSDYTNDVLPSGVEGVSQPIHQLMLVAMGTPLFDNLDLEAVAAEAARQGRWEFMLVVEPLRVERGAGSPVNPVAIF